MDQMLKNVIMIYHPKTICIFAYSFTIIDEYRDLCKILKNREKCKTSHGRMHSVEMKKGCKKALKTMKKSTYSNWSNCTICR